ncbi:MAG: LytTR family DNA-binding domain-containing protein [Prevotella sp.]|nr:LytTR family DNA-binding domain-containing protein [Prevotella sp.]
MIATCAIIDDEPLAADLLASYVTKMPELKLTGTFNSAIKAMALLREHPTDILFLDIQMPELSGLELASILPKETKVVFVTAFDSYAIDGYKVSAADYLLKPVSFEKFVTSVHKVLESLDSSRRLNIANNAEYIFLKSEYKLVKVNFNDIAYVEGLKDYIKVYFKDGRKPIVSLMNLKTMEEALPTSTFMRIHRSYIINTACVDMIDRGRVIISGIFIPVSETYKDKFNAFVDGHTLQ